jgi:hypothetical protein
MKRNRDARLRINSVSSSRGHLTSIHVCHAHLPTPSLCFLIVVTNLPLGFENSLSVP